MQYEILFIVGQDKEAKLAEIEDNITQIITNSGANLLKDRWENSRKFAYPIQHIIRGTYVARRFEVDSFDYWDENNADKRDIVAEIERKLNLNHEILRYIVVKADKLPSLAEFTKRKNEEKATQLQKEMGVDEPEVRIKKREKAPEAPKVKTEVETTAAKDDVIKETTEAPIIKKEKVAKKEATKKIVEKTKDKEVKEDAEVKKPKKTKKEKVVSEEEINQKLDEILNL